MRVLSIDLGYRVCGYTICDVENLDIRLLKEAEINPDSRQTLPKRLNYFYSELQKQVNLFKPNAIVAEKLYSHYRHPTTLGLLAQVRGVIVLLAEREGIDFFEFSPTRARKSFLGRGNVNSEQVKKMAENVVGKSFKSMHTADAFSLAVAFSHLKKAEKLGLFMHR